MTAPHCILFSPHCDDAAYSLGGSLLADLLGIIHVVSLFTLTDYWIWESASVEDVTAYRKSEEKEAIGPYVNWLDWEDLPDAVCRNRGLFARLERRLYNRFARTVHKAVRRRIDESACDLALFPAGTGMHPDHILLAKVGLELAKTRMPVLFYLDQPYGSRVFQPCDLRGPLAGQASEFKLLRGAAVAEKERLVYSYRSQVNEPLLQDILGHYRTVGGEILMARTNEAPLLDRFPFRA